MIDSRKISPNEKLYFSAQKIAPPFAIQMVLDGHGKVSRKDLRAAVRGLLAIDPWSHVVKKGKNWVPSPHPQNVRESLTTFEQEVRAPLEAASKATGEVVCFKENNKILFRVFHGAMDAKGVLCWIENIFRMLNAQAVQKSQSHPNDLGFLQKNPYRGKRAKIRLEHPPLFEPASANGAWQWGRVSIEGPCQNALPKMLKFLASFQGGLNVMLPVDLRRYDPHHLYYQNLSHPIFLNIESGLSVDEIQATLAKAILRKEEQLQDPSELCLKKCPQFILNKMMQAIIELSEHRKKYPTQALISHLGRQSLAKFSTASFSAKAIYSIPLQIPLAPFSAVIMEHDHGVEFLFGLECKNKKEVLDWENTFYKSLQPKKALLLGEKGSLVGSSLVDQLWKHCTFKKRVFGCMRKLIDLGCVPQDRIILVAQRVPAFLDYVLACLKMGLTFVPMDPEFPKDRKDRITSLAQAKAVVDVCAAVNPLEHEPYFEFKQSLAYILFTSGSSGEPKGVPISHKNLHHYLNWASQVYLNGKPTHGSLFTSLAFDLSITSLLLPLYSGGQTTFYPRGLTPFTVKEIFSSKAQLLKLTPAHLELIAKLGLGSRQSLVFVVGGDTFPYRLFAKLKDMFPNARFFDEYGPTETTVGCTASEVCNAQIQSIGTPSFDSQIGIFSSGKLLHQNQRGEICVHGPGVFAGYLRAQRNPFFWFQGLKFYRTGDQGVVGEDGKLYFKGRLDQQVKLRGYRIEISEIERIMNAHPKCTDAMVKLNGSQLVAVFTGIQIEWQPFLSQHLAPYMIPNKIHRVEGFELDLNGKKVFPNIAWGSQQVEMHQEDLLQTYCKQLRLDPVDFCPHSTFYQLGGDSLSLIDLCTKVFTGHDRLQKMEIWMEYPNYIELAKLAAGGLQSMRSMR